MKLRERTVLAGEHVNHVVLPRVVKHIVRLIVCIRWQIPTRGSNCGTNIQRHAAALEQVKAVTKVGEARVERTFQAMAMAVKHVSAFAMAGEAQGASLALAAAARECAGEGLCRTRWLKLGRSAPIWLYRCGEAR